VERIIEVEMRAQIVLGIAICAVGCGGPDEAGSRPDGGMNEAGPAPDGARGGDGSTPDGSIPDRPPGGDGSPDVGGPSEAGSAATSPGCGNPAIGTSRYERRTITVGGVEREYFLWVPRTYVPNRPYPIIFRWHGTTGNGTSGGLEIEASVKEDALIASPSGLAGRWNLDPAGPDVALFDALLAQLGTELCLDTHRVFSYGFSAGGNLTNLLACIRPTVIRGAAPVEAGPTGSNCTGRVAAWITHGTMDTTVTPARGIAARDRYLQLDGCSATAVPEPPSPCVRYQGCAPGYPVVWCQTDSDHNPQGPFTGPGAWAFFRSLP
jgi:polyhydroxybutyrate depolymerase